MVAQCEKKPKHLNGCNEIPETVIKPLDKLEEVYTDRKIYGTSSMDIDELLFSPNLIVQDYELQEGKEDVGRALDSNKDRLLLRVDMGTESTQSLLEVKGESSKHHNQDSDTIKDVQCGPISGAVVDDDDLAGDVVAVNSPVDEQDILDSVYPEDFSFSLDFSVHSIAPNDLQSMKESPPTIATKQSDISQEMVRIQSNAQPQNDINGPLMSPIPDATVSSRSSPPLLPLDTSELRFLQTPSPSSSLHLHTHHASVDAVEHVEYPVNSFYGLPVLVLTLLQQHRGIQQLYGWCKSYKFQNPKKVFYS